MPGADRAPSWYKKLNKDRDDRIAVLAQGAVEKQATGQDRAARLLQVSMSRKKQSTLRSYVYALKSFAVFLGKTTPAEAIAQLLNSDNRGDANFMVLEYLTWLESKGVSASTIRTRLAAIKAPIADARLAGWIDWGIDVKGPPKSSVKEVEGPTPEEFTRILKVVSDATGDTGVRNKAIIYLLAFKALRRNEILSLDLKHLDARRRRISVLRKGQSKREWLTLPSATFVAIDDWVDMRGAFPGPLFINFDRSNKGKSRRLTGDSLYRIVKKIGKLADVPRLHPHAFRHFSITELLEITDGNTRMAQKHSGHRDPRMLDVYEDKRQDLPGQAAQMIEDKWVRSARGEDDSSS